MILSGTERFGLGPSRERSTERNFGFCDSGSAQTTWSRIALEADYLGSLGEIALDTAPEAERLLPAVLTAIAVSRWKPAAPSIDRATAWTAMVKQRPMVRGVGGLERIVSRRLPGWFPRRSAILS